MAKSKSGRREGSAKPQGKSVYGATPKTRVGNPNQLLGKNIPNCSPKAHLIGAPRDSKK